MLGIRTPALPASLRRTNERTVVSLLMRLGRASRADLAKAAGISQPTSGKIIAELERLGLLADGRNRAPRSVQAGKLPESSPRLGRPGQMLALDSTRPRFVGVELGVNETRVSGLPVAVKDEEAWDFSFPTPNNGSALRRALENLAKEIPVDGLWGLLLSVPGIVDEAAGEVLFCPNLHWLEKTDLPKLAGPLWDDVPVLLVQEIRALALGHVTASAPKESFFLVDFGFGVGGAIVAEGALYSSANALNGEFGHTPVPGNHRRCGCGATGCLETLVSQRGLLASFEEAQNRKGSDWAALVAHVGKHGVEPWLAHTLDHTANVIAGALNVLGIHRVVVTGILAELPGVALGYLGDAVKAGALWARFGEVSFEAAPRRRAAGLVAVGLDKLVFPHRR